MKKTNKLFNIKTGLLFLVLAFSFVILFSNAGVLFSQNALPKEVCNGVDDNGDGRVDEDVNCDHYLSYLIDKSINPINVVLRDQFISFTDFQLVLIERLFNPVRKIHDGITFNPRRPNLHYLAYRLETPVSFAPRSVLIENQFERRNISVTSPRYLLTPTGKKKSGIPIEKIISQMPSSVANRVLAAVTPPIPQNANHYLCYDIEPYDIAKGVSAKDQFQSRQFEVIRARYLCNPVEKMHNGKVSEIIDENNHLVCYEVIPHNQLKLKVLTNDQFGLKSQKTVQTEEICVPTIKTHIEPTCIQPDEHGTAVIFAEDKQYHNIDNPFVIVPMSLATTGLTADAMLMSGPDTTINRSGTPEAGETYTFDTEMLQMSISNGRVLNIPMNGQIQTSPRMPGNPVQSFDTVMMQLQGQLPPGDPDFDLLRVTAGTGFGLPSPGHTTLMQLPDGTWNVDSFFDITYRIDFVGAPGGPLAGQSDSTVGTVRLQGSCMNQE